ncbi:MAG: peptidoglycan DD-metalloendopeptidase family protein [Oscillospiraceae bacterium]|jgi:murein DD-endopeptidase MepM/ murein hydrolase activator NlpD|nr:peptidoglycan DD-metalloendopeptidase family protein [Oscillospiraceae bacterium]
MQEKKTIAQKIGGFLAGRGFYIVLLACVAVIGVSAWTLLAPRNTKGGSYVDYSKPGAITPASEPEREQFPSELPVTEPRPPREQESEPASLPQPTAVPAAAETEQTPEDASAAAGISEPEPEPVKAPQKTIADLTFVRPIAGDISMPYSVEALVYSRTMGDWRTHAGVDISGALGAKVQAVCDGAVTEIKKDDMLGTTVIIDHGFGLQSVYANLASEPAVKVGDKVSTGSVIGAVGDTALGESGEVTHLHFEMMLNGESRDPMKYITDRASHGERGPRPTGRSG